MTIMYVDDSGSPSYRDHTNYFVLSRVIVNDNKIKNLQKSVLEYKHSNFMNEFIDAEIHTYDIYQSRGDFKFQDHLTKITLLNKLYEMIGGLDCAGIIVTINKNKLQKEQPKWDVLHTAWSFLLEKYEVFLQENSTSLGKIKIDKSSNSLYNKTTNIIQIIMEAGTSSQKFSRIAQPTFADSSRVFGIQVADAFAYCALKRKTNDYRFARYWDVVYGKLVRNKIQAFSGYQEYPK